MAGAQYQFRFGDAKHCATVVKHVHGMVLPPEVKCRMAGDHECNRSADRPQPADQQGPGMRRRAAGVARGHASRR